MSELPRGWVQTTLGEICDVNPPVDRGALTPEELSSFVPMASVEEETGRLDPSEKRPFGDLRRRSYRGFVESDVLVAKITPSMENGKGAVASGLENKVGFGSTEFHVLRPRSEVEPWFLLRFVLRKSFRAEAARHMTGTAGQLRVPASYLGSARLPLPPLAEQRRIVAAIEEHFSRLDAAEESLRRAKRRLVRLKKAAISEAIRGDWPTVRLGGVTKSQTYGSSVKTSPDPSGVPVLRMGNIQDGKIDLGDLKYLPSAHPDITKCDVRAGDLLFNRTNSPELVGKSAVFRTGPKLVACASYLIRVRLTPECEPEWAALVINGPAGREYVARVRTQQVGQANVNGIKLAAMPIPLPPITEQRRIVAEVERQLSLVDALAAASAAALKRSAALRRSILERAFSGKLVPQDPSDEPASIVLERIRAERAAEAPTRKTRRSRSGD